MANNIYKAGVPSQYGVQNQTGIPTPPSITGKAVTSNTTVSPSYGTPVNHGANSDNGTTVYGVKQAGSLNANGVLTVAPGKNTPQS